MFLCAVYKFTYLLTYRDTHRHTDAHSHTHTHTSFVHESYVLVFQSCNTVCFKQCNSFLNTGNTRIPKIPSLVDYCRRPHFTKFSFRPSLQHLTGPLDNCHIKDLLWAVVKWHSYDVDNSAELCLEHKCLDALGNTDSQHFSITIHSILSFNTSYCAHEFTQPNTDRQTDRNTESLEKKN